MRLKNIKTLATVTSLAFSAHTFAGGFQLWEQDVSDLGDYHAGAAAEADTAGVEFYNPAAVTHLKQQQVSFGAALINLDVNYSGTVNVFGSSQQVVNHQAGDTMNWVPNFHYVLPLPHHLWFSFGETTPFGLQTDYQNGASPVKYLATETKLKTINLNPSLAYEINRYVSIAAGFDALYGSADYDSALSLIGNDSTISTDLSHWAYGYNAGVLFDFTPQTRLGLSYRSKITVNASGDSSASAIQALGLPQVDTTASATLPLPATSIVSLYHDFSDRFSMMATAFYTQWSSFNALVIENIATPIGAQTIALNENYRNTWNLALGGKYFFSRFLSMEAGVGHDETPTQTGYRDIRLPDNNRYAASLGLNIYPKKGVQWSMGWTHFFVPATAIDNTQQAPTNPLLPTGVGTEHGNINVIGTQFSVVI